MFVYRISKKSYINDLSGTGAALYGGRWNPKGVSLCYTSGTVSLAYLEFLVHNYHILKTAHICLAKIFIDAENQNAIEEISADGLPPEWNDKHVISNDCQKVGKQFVQENEAYSLKLPSVIVPDEYNYLLNPLHSLHRNTEIVDIIDPLKYDSRLMDLAG